MNRTNLLLLVVLVASAVGWPQPPPPPPGAEDIPEECRPKPPQHAKERACCDLPKPTNSDQFITIFEECKEQIKSEHPEVMPPHFPHPPPPAGGPPPPPAGGLPPPPPPHHGGPRLFMACMDECLFNKSGILVDIKLNEEAINKIVDRFEPDSIWKPITLEAVKFCYNDIVNKTKADETDEKCNPLAHEITKCTAMQMYLKCPSEKWQNTDDCNAERQLLEKCPNLAPHAIGPLHPPMKKKE